MRIYNKSVSRWDDKANRYILIESESEWFDYIGPLCLSKGSNSSAEMDAANQQRAMENQLMNQQLAMQQGQINMVDPTLQAIISNGGMLPSEQAALTSLTQNQLGQAYQQGVGQINQNLVARGLSGGQTGAGGGGIAAGYGQMAAMLGNAQQAGLSNIQLQKAQGLQNAMNTTLGIGSMYGQNIGAFNSGASSALNSGVTAANNADQAATSWMGPVFGALTGLGSAAMGKGAFTCWIASECFGGMDVPKVQFIRMRLWHNAQNSFKFKAILAAYAVFGRLVAKMVKRFGWLKRMFISIFDKFVSEELDKMLNEAVKNG